MPGSVRGRVVRADNGRPLADATIGIVRSAGPAPDIAPITNGEGWFALEGLPAGEWELSALGPGGETGSVSVRVSAGSVSDVTITVGARESESR
jgi:Carboxypeptidase regulatory-like domain